MCALASAKESKFDPGGQGLQRRTAEESKAVARFATGFRAARLRSGLFVGLFASPAAARGIADAVKGVPGVDVSTLTPGVARAAVESGLGAPARSWVSEHGVRYSLYEFDIGVPPSGATAAAMLVMDVATAGVWELVWAADEELKLIDRKSGRVLVSFDEEGCRTRAV